MHHGSVGQDSPIEHLGEATEMAETEAEVEMEETHHQQPELEETEKSEAMGRS